MLNHSLSLNQFAKNYIKINVSYVQESYNNKAQEV